MLRKRERSVIVAMRAVMIVEMPVDEIIDMIPVRNGFVTAVAAVRMACVVAAARMRGGTRDGVGARDFEAMLVDVTVVYEVQVSVVQEIDVVGVLHARVRAIGAAVRMRVVGMCGVFHSGITPRNRVRAQMSIRAIRYRVANVAVCNFGSPELPV
ncbi:MAG: hypothetical protein NVSMB19_06720 [Vulcanimicrobiaceae bacterium]